MKSSSKKICVVTGTRAEYGLLRLLMKDINREKGLELQLIVTGSHLSKSHGYTYKEIVADGFKIDRKCKIIDKYDDPLAIVRSMSKAIVLLSKSFSDLKPDIVVLLGDRYELLSAASCCNIMKIPIAHIHGGETTQGAFDEAIRHSITKMAHIHFVANSIYGKRVRQLGESEKNIFNVGGLGVDNLQKTDLYTKRYLIKNLGISFNKKNILITYHPVTLNNLTEKNDLKNLFRAVGELKDTNIFFTMPNADTNNQIIFKLIKKFCLKKNNYYYFTSLGQVRYYSMLKNMDAVVGNSSSGLLEAPSFKIGTINIGDRQKGRLQASSIINCESNCKSIILALKKLYSKSFQKKLKSTKNPYGPKGASKKIIRQLKRTNFVSLKKEFKDLNVS